DVAAATASLPRLLMLLPRSEPHRRQHAVKTGSQSWRDARFPRALVNGHLRGGWPLRAPGRPQWPRQNYGNHRLAGCKFGGLPVALTMIKKALPFRFLSMCQADRMADRLAGVVWTILGRIPGALWAFSWKRRPSGAIPSTEH